MRPLAGGVVQTPSSALTKVDELPPGTAVERYEVLGTLGAGGMATVYAAQHRQLGTLHALKVLAYDLPSLRRRAVQEGQAQASLQHPNVVAMTRSVTHRGVPVLVMELVAGPSLEALCREHRLSLWEVDTLGRGILAGVARAHGRGLIHRDLKPANVLIAIEDRGLLPKITDFGLVKLLMVNGPVQQTQLGAVMGTPPYMSPEQLTDASQVDARTDVWALGVLLYELCTGRRPFPGDTTEELLGLTLAGEFEPPERLAPGLPPRMQRAITLALTPEREQRPPSAQELLAEWAREERAAVAGGWRAESLAAARRLTPPIPERAPRVARAVDPVPRARVSVPPVVPRKGPRWPALALGALALGSALAVAVGLLR
jgi:eukaryotic-like serine/threonine-protein kinase